MRPEPYLTVPEVAELLAVDQKTVRRLIERAELPALKVGRIYRIAPSAIDALAVAPRRKPTAAKQPRPLRTTSAFAARARKRSLDER
jgi:excisionase family DNA binding protein